MSVIFNPASVAGGSGITQLTGDVTAGPGSGSQVATLATVNANVGTWGDATHVGQFTVNAKGLITAASNVAISGAGGGMSIGGAIVGGTTPSVLFIGAGNVLAQDVTNFTWDDTNFQLKIGHTGGPATTGYYLSGLPSLYMVPNASGANWFEGNAGNTTLTGYQNFGTGDGALAGLTTGYQNTCVGTNGGNALTTGFQNFTFGTSALQFSQTDSNNVAIGVRCLQVLGSGGAGGGGNAGNFASGFAALASITQGNSNVAIGYTSLANSVVVTSQNVVIGAGAGGNIGSSGTVGANTLVGCNAGASLVGGCSANTWIGGFQGSSVTITDSIAIGSGTAAKNLLDFHVSTPNTWTFSAVFDSQGPAAIHVYNTSDVGSQGKPASIINYERAAISWRDTANVFRLETQKGGTGVLRLIAIDGFQKAGAPAAADLPSTTWTVINDTSGGQTWLVYNNAGTIRKVQLV